MRRAAPGDCVRACARMADRGPLLRFAAHVAGDGGALTALAGALIMVTLTNFCVLQGCNDNWQRLIIGMLIIGLVY